MKMLKVSVLEDCFDGSYIRNISLDSEITKEFIDYLMQNKNMSLEYYADFARPFFRIESKGNFRIKGVQGNDNFRLVLYKSTVDDIVEYLRKIIAEF